MGRSFLKLILDAFQEDFVFKAASFRGFLAAQA
jgi:hypothetical protein